MDGQTEDSLLIIVETLHTQIQMLRFFYHKCLILFFSNWSEEEIYVHICKKSLYKDIFIRRFLAYTYVYRLMNIQNNSKKHVYRVFHNFKKEENAIKIA